MILQKWSLLFNIIKKMIHRYVKAHIVNSVNSALWNNSRLSQNQTAGVLSDTNNTSGYDWHKINAVMKKWSSLLTSHNKHSKSQSLRVCHFCPTLCLSDILCERAQAEWQSGGLERSGPLLLPRGGSGGHRGVPAGAFTGGPAGTHSRITSELHGATDTHTFPSWH